MAGLFTVHHMCYICIAMLAILLPEDIEKRLDDLARRTGRTKTFYARQAILDQLDDLEDLYLAEKRWLALQQGKSRAVSLADVEAELGLGG
jgi:RHH-type transcriptional regulator, rel operon repressor / antitoxin RelB